MVSKFVSKQTLQSQSKMEGYFTSSQSDSYDSQDSQSQSQWMAVSNRPSYIDEHYSKLASFADCNVSLVHSVQKVSNCPTC